MQGQKDSTHRPFVWVGVALIAALVGLAGGLALANALLETGDRDLEARLSSAETQLAEAQGEVQSLQTDLAKRERAYQELTQALEQSRNSEETLKASLSSVQEELAKKASELASLASAQTDMALQYQQRVEELEDLADALESHRLLLVELRKDMPQTREEAFTYWDKVKSLASRADPSLVPPVDRVILRIDNYFDWDERNPGPTASSEEYLDWLADYTLSGAVTYEDAIGGFNKDTLLAVITQMDSVVGHLE